MIDHQFFIFSVEKYKNTGTNVIFLKGGHELINKKHKVSLSYFSYLQFKKKEYKPNPQLRVITQRNVPSSSHHFKMLFVNKRLFILCYDFTSGLQFNRFD